MLFKNKRALRFFQVVFCLFLMTNLLPPGAAFADPGFTADSFQVKWQRSDKPVGDGSANPARSWLWGPESFTPTGGDFEPYAESPGGTRRVVYFDKARMELNNPATNTVTNGLLVRELISGRLATGDSTYTQRQPAGDIPVAGDPTGNDGPTYATFAKIASLSNDNPSTDRTGQAAIETIDKGGNISNNDSLSNLAHYIYFDQNLKHNIPDVFLNFMNQKGNVWVDGKLVDNQPVLGENPLAPWVETTGLPITEAYWAKIVVKGQQKDVLIQAFERRVLTFTPSNEKAFQVEMGNVGRHYFSWRYNSGYDLPVVTPQPSTPAVKSCEETPTGSVQVFVKCGPAGMQAVALITAQPGETVIITPVSPEGKADPTVYFKADAKTGKLEAHVDTAPGAVQGMWVLKIKALTTGIESVANIWLEPPLDTSKGRLILAVPKAIYSEQRVVLMIFGFKPNELLHFMLRNPEGNTGKATEKYRTGSFGSYTDNIIPDINISPARFKVPGQYLYSAIADDDGSRFSQATFTLLRKPV